MTEKVKEQASERLMNLIVGWAESLGNSLEKGVDFALDQASSLVHEIITYTIAIDVFYIVIWIVFLISSVRIIKWCLRKKKEIDEKPSYEDDLPYIIIIIFLSILSFAFSLIIILGIFPEILKAIFAPRLFLIEYLKDFVK